MNRNSPKDVDRLEIRRYASGDRAEVLALLGETLGWVPNEQHERFFDWKHADNPFGASSAWVATDGDRLVGFRTLLRWEFTWAGRTLKAVRAVDTATHPEYQGRGIFSKLTLHGVDELRAKGVDFVFNTPNEQSRPGYLKMGWQIVARFPVLFRPRSVRRVIRLARARVPADKWSLPSSAGVAAAEVLGNQSDVASLLEHCPRGQGLTTRRSPEFLAWRYGFGPLQYRAVLVGGSVPEGVVLFRLRRRGGAIEAAICDVLVPAANRGQLKALLARTLKQSGADYAVRLGGPAVSPLGFFRVPGQGPILVWRGLASTSKPELAAWRLVLGDIELF